MEKNIAVIKGDGIGPEIVTEAMKVLDAVAKKYNHKFNYKLSTTPSPTWLEHLWVAELIAPCRLEEGFDAFEGILPFHQGASGHQLEQSCSSTWLSLPTGIPMFREKRVGGIIHKI